MNLFYKLGNLLYKIGIHDWSSTEFWMKKDLLIDFNHYCNRCGKMK